MRGQEESKVVEGQSKVFVCVCVYMRVSACMCTCVYASACSHVRLHVWCVYVTACVYVCVSACS